MIIEPDFLTHWKTLILIEELEDKAAPLYVISLWAYCQQRKTDQLTGMAPKALKAICRYEGEASKLRSALERAGFIDVDGEAVTVHGWAECNSKLVANWTNGSRGGRPKKPENPAKEKPTENPKETQTKPNGTQLGVGLTQREPIREDKSREDKSRIEKREKERKKPPKENLSLFKSQLDQSVERAKALFSMRPSTALDRSQLTAVKSAEQVLLELSEDDWKLLEEYYAAPQAETYSRKSLAAFLNNINGELTKAHRWTVTKKDIQYVDGRI